MRGSPEPYPASFVPPWKLTFYLPTRIAIVCALGRWHGDGACQHTCRVDIDVDAGSPERRYKNAGRKRAIIIGASRQAVEAQALKFLDWFPRPKNVVPERIHGILTAARDEDGRGQSSCWFILGARVSLSYTPHEPRTCPDDGDLLGVIDLRPLIAGREREQAR